MNRSQGDCLNDCRCSVISDGWMCERKVARGRVCSTYLRKYRSRANLGKRPSNSMKPSNIIFP